MRLFLPFLLFLFSFGLPSSLRAQDAGELAADLAAILEDGDSFTRLKMKVGGETLQVQVKARRTSSGSDVLYQVLFPKERKGEAVLLKKSGSGAATGVQFKLPDVVTKVGSGDVSNSLLGSELALQDVIENFFRWKDQTIEGKETIDRVECTVLVSKPGSGDSTPYGSVKSWIDTRRMVALKVEKFDKAGNRVRTITTTRVAKDDRKVDLGAGFSVQKEGGASATEVDGANIRHDVKWSDDDFSTAAMADLRMNRD